MLKTINSHNGDSRNSSNISTDSSNHNSTTTTTSNMGLCKFIIPTAIIKLNISSSNNNNNTTIIITSSSINTMAMYRTTMVMSRIMGIPTAITKVNTTAA